MMQKPSASQLPENLEPAAAERLVAEGAVRVLDVRTPEEFAQLGHIPGAQLLPVDLIPTALGTVPPDGPPVLVVCEHGVRSAFAARFLARAGYPGVLNLAGGMSRWSGPRDHAPASPFVPPGPNSWLVENADLLPRNGRALDVACGGGRHAFLLAAVGLSVDAVDRDLSRLAQVERLAEASGLPVAPREVDLEADEVDLGDALYDLILVVHYLHRPLFPALRRALRPGGLLLYETFTVEQAQRGHPRNPAFLLERGELMRLAAPLTILRQREGEFDGRHVSGVAARRER